MPVYLYIRIFIGLILIGFAIGCSPDGELSWVDEDGYRWAELKTGLRGSTGFEKRNLSRSGIDFRNDVSDEIIRENRHYANGSGVAVGDVTGNGFPDIYFASLEGSNVLYENLGGFRFRNITEEAGVAHDGYNSTGVVFTDVNGNGHLDLFITSLSDQNTLYLNDGSGVFSRKEDSGLGESSGSHSMALADINGNGLPDLYIANYRLHSVRDLYGPEDLSMENTTEVNEEGRLNVLPEFEEYFQVIETDGVQSRHELGAYDELYINRGDGTFEKADPLQVFTVNDDGEAGLFQDWGFTPIFRDITGNGAPDLYVVNDFWTPDRLWINSGDGTFRAAHPDAIQSQSFSSMGVDFTDLSKNGRVDFVITEMLSAEHERRLRQYSDYLGEYQGATHHNRNSVYLNRGDTTFAQIAHYSGLEATEWSWATTFMDVNLNGHEDLIVATGFYRDYLDMDAQIKIHRRYQEMGEEMMQQQGEFIQFPSLTLQNKIYQNNGDLTFTETSSNWGFQVEDISMGMAVADLNNNGTPDLIINRFNDEAAIYENTTNNPRIAVRLNGKAPNTRGIGAKVELLGGPVPQSKEMGAGGIYLSGSQYQMVFAAEEASGDHTIVVTWRNGTQSRIENVKANRIYEIDEEATAYEAGENPSAGEKIIPMFEDMSEVIGHQHHESSYDDFQRVQPLLPKSLSRKGPGAGWIDLNNNGLDDLFITSGKDGRLAIFENLGNGNFEPAEINGLNQEAPGDQTAIASWAEDEQVRFVIGSSNFEQGSPNAASAYIHTIRYDGTAAVDSIPGVLSSTGPVAAADYSGNGAVDLFVGGHFLPGGYPRNATSRLFLNQNGEFVPDQQNVSVFAEIGLVTGAVFADFTQNGLQDLLVSTEWGPMKLFENRNGRFVEITEETGLDQWKGWWNGVASGDFTNNGLTDFVATNIGRNSPYKPGPARPLRLCYEDINLNGQLDIVDAYYHEGMGTYVPRRKLLDFGSVRTILQNVSSHEEFSTSSVDKIFGLDFSEIPCREINTVEHLVFINNGNGFDAHPLPSKAQFSTGYHVAVADFDNNGNEDLFISQNSFEFPQLITRQSSGRGLLLKGNGEGGFEPVSGQISGIKIYGEQRGAAVADFNRNGRTDLVVSQNGGETRLFQNRTENPGVRVTLNGPPSNRNAIGSSVRMIYSDGTKGPRRGIHSGSGYRSQNSPTQVLGIAEGKTAAGIEITWFEGSVQVEEVEEGRAEIVIGFDPDD
jgi:enediyne biosynthesis protein E4